MIALCWNEAKQNHDNWSQVILTSLANKIPSTNTPLFYCLNEIIIAV